MTKYEVPMIWQECGSIIVEAETPEEAHDLALSDDYGLPDEDQSSYVEGSAEVDEAFLAEPDNYIHNVSPIMRLQERAKKDPEFAKRLETAIDDLIERVNDEHRREMLEVVRKKKEEAHLDAMGDHFSEMLDENIAAALNDEGDSIK